MNEIADRAETCCSRLSPLICRRHRIAFIGGYDLHVVTEALHERGQNLFRHDDTLPVGDINLNAERLTGILVNDMYHTRFGHLNYRHWLALRKVDGVWYAFDSNLHGPMPFEDGNQVRFYLEYIFARPYGRIYLVRRQLQLGN